MKKNTKKLTDFKFKIGNKYELTDGNIYTLIGTVFTHDREKKYLVLVDEINCVRKRIRVEEFRPQCQKVIKK